MDSGLVRLLGVWVRGAFSCMVLSALTACGPAQDPLDPDASVEGGRPPVLDGGGGIPDPPNGASLCPQGSCNYQTQQGCQPEAAAPTACQPYPQDGGVGPTCGPAGMATAGQGCSSWLDCAPGLLCAGGSCRRLCCGGDYTACPAGEHCFSPLLVLIGDAAVNSGAMLCMPAGHCDVFTGNTCPAGQACHIVDPTGAVACVPEGAGTSAEPCPCSAGFTCVGQRCRQLCSAVELGGPPWCGADEICVHYDRDPAGVGECTPYQQ